MGRRWHIECAIEGCGASGGLVEIQEHLMGEHGITLKQIQTASKRGSVLEGLEWSSGPRPLMTAWLAYHITVQPLDRVETPLADGDFRSFSEALAMAAVYVPVGPAVTVRVYDREGVQRYEEFKRPTVEPQADSVRHGG